MSPIFLSSVILIISLHISQGQISDDCQVVADNKFDRNDIGQYENIYCNPLQLNEEPLDYSTFDVDSKGVLTLVKGNPSHDGSVRIPFYIQLQHSSGVWPFAAVNFLNQEVLEIEISKVLALAKPGDYLIIIPSRPQDYKAKRIIRLIDGEC